MARHTSACGDRARYIQRLCHRELRWKEAVIALATACGATIEAAIAEQIIAAGMAVAGLIGVVTKDKTETKKEDSDNG